MYNAFSICVRHAFKLPWNSHKFFIEPITNVSHLKTQLCSRFVKFVEKNEKCSKPIIRLLSTLCKADNRTVYCRNLKNIANECNVTIDDLCSNTVKNNMTFAEVGRDSEWRIDMLMNLLAIKFDNLYLDNFDFRDINIMINHVSTT